MRVILASKSPARLKTLQNAGVYPQVQVSGVDETQISAATAPELVQALAAAKGEAVTQTLPASTDAIVLACDTVLEFDNMIWGKPKSAQQAVERWHYMCRRSGLLHTGHYVARLADGEKRTLVRLATTKVTFADLTDTEIQRYVDSGEPQQVAGGFTIDGLGGPFISRVEGDPHNVVGISLPLVRLMLADLGLSWTALWH